METKISIYVLCDPSQLCIRYIGITSKTLQQRLHKHLDESRYSKKKNHRINWIRSLLSTEKIPIIRKISEVDSWEEALVKEKHLVEKYKLKKNLVNCEDYIDSGRFGKKPSEEVKKKISDTLRLYFKENKSQISKCIKAYDFNSMLVGEYSSIIECSKSLSINSSHICAVLKKKIRQYKGYYFRYCSDDSPLENIVGYDPHSKIKKTIAVHDTWKNEQHNFESFSEASKFLGITVGTLSYLKKSQKRELFRYRYKLMF